MAGSKSNYLENKVLDHVLGGGDYTRPGSVYLALFTARGTDADTEDGIISSSSLVEVSGGSYARLEVANDVTHFPAAVAGVKTNGTQIVFAQATASWGTVIAVGIYDALAGNLLYWADLDAPKLVSTDDIVVFDANSLTFTED